MKPKPKALAVIPGVVLAVGVLLIAPPGDLDPRGMRVLGVAILMATFWVTEALPIPVTSLLPLLLFPLLGVLSSDQVAGEYANDLIYLFFGGFYLAIALEKWNLHRRCALRVLLLFGTKPSRMILGVMFAVAVLSMWISNTATALMMLPICLAIIDQVGEQFPDDASRRRFGISLLLATAYGANVGGMGTPIGTGPNGIFLRLVDESLRPTFATWMLVAIPLVAVFLILIWLMLTRVLFRLPPSCDGGDPRFVRDRLRDLGPMKQGERRVLAIFVFTVIAWITRRDLGIGGVTIPGWVSGLDALGFDWITSGARDGVGDSVVSILAVVLLSVVRSEGQPLMSWDSAKKIPWGMLLLLGGGFALAKGFQVPSIEEGKSLSVWIGERLVGAQDLPPVVLIGLVCLVMTFLTEITSNTATCSVTLPILITMGSAEDSLLICLAATFSASCAFMLPVATPPNAIIFASGRFTIPEMMRAGVLINLMGTILITTLVYTLGRWILIP